MVIASLKAVQLWVAQSRPQEEALGGGSIIGSAARDVDRLGWRRVGTIETYTILYELGP